MATTMFGQVCDALLAAVAAQPGYRGFGGASGVLVLDSTQGWQTDVLTDSYLVVGWTDPDGDTRSGEAEQSSATAGKVTRDEVGEVACRAVGQFGDVDPKAARDGALAIVAAVEAVLRATPNLGLVPSQTPRLHAQMSSRRRMTFDQYLGRGAVCAVTFSVHYEARI